jgi:hypothetical protein
MVVVTHPTVPVSGNIRHTGIERVQRAKFTTKISHGKASSTFETFDAFPLGKNKNKF